MRKVERIETSDPFWLVRHGKLEELKCLVRSSPTSVSFTETQFDWNLLQWAIVTPDRDWSVFDFLLTLPGGIEAFHNCAKKLVLNILMDYTLSDKRTIGLVTKLLDQFLRSTSALPEASQIQTQTQTQTQNALPREALSYARTVPVARFLLERKANVNVLLSNGEPTINAFAYRGNVEVVKLLVEHKAEVCASTLVAACDGSVSFPRPKYEDEPEDPGEYAKLFHFLKNETTPGMETRALPEILEDAGRHESFSPNMMLLPLVHDWCRCLDDATRSKPLRRWDASVSRTLLTHCPTFPFDLVRIILDFTLPELFCIASDPKTACEKFLPSDELQFRGRALCPKAFLVPPRIWALLHRLSQTWMMKWEWEERKEKEIKKRERQTGVRKCAQWDRITCECQAHGHGAHTSFRHWFSSCSIYAYKESTEDILSPAPQSIQSGVGLPHAESLLRWVRGYRKRYLASYPKRSKWTEEDEVLLFSGEIESWILETQMGNQEEPELCELEDDDSWFPPDLNQGIEV